mmetsp:Transcript_15714/g.13740  ORF Transcript_15714/g.13740 Transcript_15714/m.13740 type:complete len:110 (-) Transcript_15714:153-482(-)
MASPATIVPSEQGKVNGVALCLTESEVAKVDVFEGAPLTYRQEEVEIVLGSGKEKGQKVEGLVYVRNDNSIFVPPSQPYLEAVTKTLEDFRELKGDKQSGPMTVSVRHA